MKETVTKIDRGDAHRQLNRIAVRQRQERDRNSVNERKRAKESEKE